MRRSARLGLVLLASLSTTLVGAQEMRVAHVRRETWVLQPVTAHGVTYRAVAFDGHVHTAHSLDARHTVHEVLSLGERLDLDAVVVTDHGSSSAVASFDSYRGHVRPILGEEVGGSYGHAVLWNLSRRVDNPEVVDEIETLGPFVHAQGGLVVLAHPGWWIRGQESDPRRWMQYDALRRGGIAEHVDALELWNGTYPAQSGALVAEWARLLDRGLYVPIVGNSDFHRVGGQHLGTPRNVIFCAEDGRGNLREPVDRCLVDAVRAGRLYVTSGPSSSFTLNDALPGEIVEARPGETLHLALHALDPEGGRLVVHLGSTVAAQIDLEEGRVLDRTISIRTPAEDAFVRIEIERRDARAGHEPFSLVSNPVRIDVPPRRDGWRGPDPHGVSVAAPEGFRAPRLRRARAHRDDALGAALGAPGSSALAP